MIAINEQIELGKYKEAVNIYQEALKYNPVSYEINYNVILL